MHISKALQSRCKAIQSALRRYNQAAVALDPPRPRLEWQDVIEYGSLAEFDLLRSGAREDIRELPWADEINRQVTTFMLRMERAKEEISRLNIEVARLNTWMHDEEANYMRCMTDLEDTDPLLCSELKERLNHCQRLNGIHQRKLARLFSTEGYTGSTKPGKQLGTTRVTLRIPALGARPMDQPADVVEDEEDKDDDDDDEDNDEMSLLEDYISSISTDDVLVARN
jgi:hypothetical protein